MRDRIGRVAYIFFQAEGGIRDVAVTGVQTCALPIYHALEIMDGIPHLQANLGHAAPVPLFHESRHSAFNYIRPIASGVLQEFRERTADNLLECRTNQVGETAVGRSNFAIEGHSDQYIVERINKITISLLRTLNDGKKFIKLLVAGRSSITLLDTANQTAQFRHLLVAFPDKQHEEGNQDNKSRTRDQQVLKSARKRADSVPGNSYVGDRQQTEKKVSQPPQLTLAAFKLSKPVADVRSRSI